jgi:phospholipid/cholesterol/gamma-HCH transport system substrate-binding protein
METKASFVLIGAFTLAGILAGFGFLLWLAKVEVDRQYAYYDVLFDSVSGLSDAGDVRYNGLPVGQVVALNLDPDDPSKVRVRLEVGADTPVKTDTIATLQSQGVTGVSFVSLSGGSPEAERAEQGSVIRSESSALQSVLEGAPVLLQKAVLLLEDINSVVNEKNRTAISQILENLASATGRMDRALENFETLSGDLGLASREIAGFVGRLDELAETTETALLAATDTLQTAKSSLENADTMIASAKTTLGTMDETFISVRTLVDGDLGDLVRQGTATAEQVGDVLTRVEPTLTTTLDTATTALGTAEQTFAAANKVISEDLDGILTDTRKAVTVFTTTIEDATGDITLISQEVLKASRSASSFANTLEVILAQNRRQVSDFLRVGLPEFLRLMEEARLLVSIMERFVDRAQRDPARFILGTQGSEFKR